MANYSDVPVFAGQPASMENGQRGSFVGQSSRAFREIARQKLIDHLGHYAASFAVSHNTASQPCRCAKV
jgi:hypothetical protein